MILEIAKIPDGHSDSAQEIDLAAFKDDLPPFAGKIFCEAAIDRSGGMFSVQLHFRGTFTLECSRCLEPFDFPMEGNLRLVIREQAGKFGPSLDDESADFFFDTRHLELDLSPAIYEEIMTAFPMKPLCRESCTGFLPGGEEAKADEPVDPRWEALKKLRNQ
jgi:uncharacterized protein